MIPSLATITEMRDLASNIKLIQVQLDDPDNEKEIYLSSRSICGNLSFWCRRIPFWACIKFNQRRYN